MHGAAELLERGRPSGRRTRNGTLARKKHRQGGIARWCDAPHDSCGGHKRGITEIIHGAAKGADSFAGHWARVFGIKETAVPADWDKHGKRAGPLRNEEMLKLKPDGVVAFPGGRGTDHMVRIAKEAGIKVMRVDEK